MKINKYMLFLLIVLILINITNINAVENDTDSLEINNEDLIEINDNTQKTCEDNNILSSEENAIQDELLAQNLNEEILSSFEPFNTQITLTVNDTSTFESDRNITVNMHFSFITPSNDGEFPTYNINIYENNTIIKTLNIGELNLPEVVKSITYTADVPFTYTVHENSYLTTSLFGVFSNTLEFKNIKDFIITNLNNTQINIDNTYSSNKSWTNSIQSLQKALNLAENNGIINLDNIKFLQDTTETIHINKNITIIGDNTSFLLEKTQTLLEIDQNTQVKLVNLIFSGNNYYIISNKGKLELINCTFIENSLGLINNLGEAELTNCKIEQINQIYQTRPTNTNGLITNTGTLKLKNTIFNNNVHILPYDLPTETTSLKGIIYNKCNITIDGVNFTNINYRLIYNDGKLTLYNSLFENIYPTSTSAVYIISNNKHLISSYIYNNYQIKRITKIADGGAIYNANHASITNTSFKNIIGNDGGAIYNTNSLNIVNTIFYSINGNNGGAIFNTKEMIIENTLFNKIQTRGNYDKGGSIYNKGECNINNSTITESKTIANSGIGGYGGGIYNIGTLMINNTIIKKCSSSGGAAIHNDGIINLNDSQIINNDAQTPIHITKEVTQPNGAIFTYITNVYGGAISNSEKGKFTITKTIIKNNTIISGTNNNWRMYFGTIKNDGNMEIRGCIFDNNTIRDWDGLFGGQGSMNLYNTGTLKIMYTSFINTPEYKLDLYPGINAHTPDDIIFNADGGKTENYYFILTFEKEYYAIKFNQTENITIKLALTNGDEIISFDDWDNLLIPLDLNMTITTVNDKGEYVNITTLINNEYTFQFNYTQNKAIYFISASILNFKSQAIVDTAKEFSEMTVTYNNITYNDGNNITFHIKVTGNLTVQPTGNVTFTYNNQKITLNLTDGECNYTITETLKPNNYTMRIDYNGDGEYFKILKHDHNFTVYKIKTNITLVAPEIRIGETGKAIITVTPGDAKLYGYLYYTKDRKYETNADTRGTRTIDLKNFGVGTYNLTVIFKEDEYYTGGTASTLFIVGKWETRLNVTADDVKPGENTTVINITINPGDVRGEAVVEINGKNETIYLNDTTTRIPVTDLEEGTYQVTVYYFGDAKYAPSNGTTTFSVARITSKITAEISYDEHMNGHVIVNTNYNNCTGEVRLYINNDESLKLNLTQGKANFTVKFKRGTNYIYIYYYGDEYYSFSTWNTTFSIDATPVLSLETQDLRSNSTGYVRINLTDTNNIPYEYTDITIEFNNQTLILKTDENGTIYYPVQLPAGKYSIKATYGNATLIKNITVKTSTELRVEIPPVNQDEDLMVYVTLTDYNNQKITGEVIVEINGQYYRVIVSDGTGSRNLGELKAGNYNYNATYIGEGLLSSSQITGNFNVAANNYRITENKNINTYYAANTVYKIKITNNNKAVPDEIVTITISKNTVKVKTDNQGYATLKLNLKAGKYTITATYKNVKVSNKITVKPTLITKNKKIKKGKTLTYTAKLLNTKGKSLKNKKIIFKINGKKYNAKTNKKGIAKIKIKNLKAGKHKILTTYAKQKNTNWITVKK